MAAYWDLGGALLLASESYDIGNPLVGPLAPYNRSEMVFQLTSQPFKVSDHGVYFEIVTCRAKYSPLSRSVSPAAHQQNPRDARRMLCHLPQNSPFCANSMFAWTRLLVIGENDWRHLIVTQPGMHDRASVVTSADCVGAISVSVELDISQCLRL